MWRVLWARRCSVHAFQKPSAQHGAQSNKYVYGMMHQNGKVPHINYVGEGGATSRDNSGGSVNKVMNPNLEKRYKWATECGSSGNQHSTHTMSISRHFAIRHSSVVWMWVVICARIPLWGWKGECESGCWPGCLAEDWNSAEQVIVSASMTWMISLVKVSFSSQQFNWKVRPMSRI